MKILVGFEAEIDRDYLDNSKRVKPGVANPEQRTERFQAIELLNKLQGTQDVGGLKRWLELYATKWEIRWHIWD